ncbi:Cu(I)-responsive transcriptional regulator [Psychromonas antarctica]|uniref:Cu(I)-responsive transcriptional regulator n=1 Tax=Psychromonas antarctica TaxID=67573 RepID=UPI001EE834A0|nr:Cu(I)-responsive transcriptional regulator [Psychromonas antarctica]MCG6202579.1 Cu(I)-responsive transcriptional regulator [Psychromonas antarctica]
MLSISQAAKKTGLSVKSIRHYEQIGLIPPPLRGDNEYRYYTEVSIKQLHFIKGTKDAGFNLKESKALLQLCENETRSSADVKVIALQKIEELQARIDQQQLLLDRLKKMTQDCHGDDQASCPIIDAFAK